MKKLLLCLLTLLVMAGCSAQTDTPKTGDTVKIEIFKGTVIDALDEKAKADLLDVYGEYRNPEMAFRVAGQNLPDLEFITYEGEKAKLEGPFILEMVGSWCSFCQELTLEGTIEKLLEQYPDIPVYQYFMYGDIGDVDAFYESAEKEIPANITVLLDNQQFDEWYNQNGYSSVPMMFVIGKDNRIGLSYLGKDSFDLYVKMIDYTMNKSVADMMTTTGKTIGEFTKEQAIAKQYISDLTEIEVPAELFK